mmetsp:Transcript_103749/g.260192  ORF Transcript_103749/g.260192 Transcript_103749/m.260192 type:complete len:286 (-) Transcript_103749:142-999(-)|eukprot:CAMPEP_0115314076 /NCGR_PEP_ID=MMETSP0270-20121206/76832_1 /TAXON_ID=71861 /ORGANISM="Scrippsiella trochoidea, Strain CCMP3099" /LENGTH=285 /DNA_ID=CAMNT_0002733263 /DNA_START=33 /DNA_END=890 /DNA_ORIENTATION=-
MAPAPVAVLGFVLMIACAAGEGPLIGVYPTEPMSSGNSYYQAYQSWVEQFGASTVLLPREGNADWYFERINALLIPGGPTRPVPTFVHAMIQRAIKAHAEGDYFPVWGTCLGFQWIAEAVGGRSVVELSKFDASDLPSTLSFNSKVGDDRIFRSANSSVMLWVEGQNSTYENHEDGIDPLRFESNPELAALFDVVATSADRSGQRYVAAVQGKDVPIYGVQFHPEKIRYVNNSINSEEPGHVSHVPKTEKARDVSDLLARFVVSEAKKSRHSADAYGASLVQIMV